MTPTRNDSGDRLQEPERRSLRVFQSVVLLFGIAFVLILFRTARTGLSQIAFLQLLTCAAPLVAALVPWKTVRRLWAPLGLAASLLLLATEVPIAGSIRPSAGLLAVAGLAAIGAFCGLLIERQPCVRPDGGRHQAQDLLKVLLAEGAEGILLCDGDMRILQVSAAVERDTGFAAQELRGMELKSLLSPAEARSVADAAGAGEGSADAGGPRWRGNVAARRRDGSRFPAAMTVRTLDDDHSSAVRFVVFMCNKSGQQQAQEEIRRQSEVDTLTGLPNRPGMIRHIEAALSAGKDGGVNDPPEIALVLIDVDDLKQVNDRYGHDAGDSVLRQFAQRLQSCIGDGDFLARQSGDEFAVVLAGAEAGPRAGDLTSRLHREIERPFCVQHGLVHLRASMGSAACPDDAADASGLIAAADQALFVAKNKGGNRVVGYDEQIGSRARDRTRLMNELQEGVERGELRLLYQPVVDLFSGDIVKAEALVRWQHPELGLLRSGRFIPLAEEGRMIDALGDWVLRQCSADLPALRDRFGADFQVSVNVSPVQLMRGATDQFAEMCARVAQMSEKGRGLILEITESAFLDPAPAMIARLNALQQSGAQIALDDFGAGHTSLLYYLTHDFEFLKIDRAFLREAPHNVRAVAICETILGFAGRLGAVAIAEGIETADQVEMLRKCGCRLGQGYLFARPLTVQDLIGMPKRFPVG